MTSWLRRTLCAAVLGCLLAAVPAAAHTIDVRRAADAVRAKAATVGEIGQRSQCWRPVIGIRRARHRAVCVVWWVRTSTGLSCTLFYEVRLARLPSRRILVSQTFDPWCAR